MSQSGKILQMAQKPTAKHTLVSDPQLAQLLKDYEAGLRAMQEHKYDKAKTLLQKVVSGTNRELADRAGVHLNACSQQLERGATQFKSTEEHYDFVVSLINIGDYVGAREHLEKLSKQVPKADYVAYGLAALDCLTGHAEDSLKNLARAITLNAALRFQARNDSDFQNLSEDPRFTELLYPDPGAEMPLPPEEEVGELG
jgi:outer membrane protein assembly factor BamD (BamD/ComL family)